MGQRHPAVASLHVEGCAAVAGRNLGAAGAFGALRALRLEGCDMLGCANLAASVQAMPGLESLSVLFCPQVRQAGGRGGCSLGLGAFARVSRGCTAVRAGCCAVG